MSALQFRLCVTRKSYVVAWLLFATTSNPVPAGKVTYRIERIGLEGAGYILGGSITTDGTLGPLAVENILAMSVDIEGAIIVINSSGGSDYTDLTGTLDLNNAALSIEGEVLATPTSIILPTPTGIGIPTPDTIGDTNSILLSAGAPFYVSWQSSYFDLGSTAFERLGLVESSTTAFGNTIFQLPEAGVIALAIPEPTTFVLILFGLLPLTYQAAYRRL